MKKIKLEYRIISCVLAFIICFSLCMNNVNYAAQNGLLDSSAVLNFNDDRTNVGSEISYKIDNPKANNTIDNFRNRL